MVTWICNMTIIMIYYIIMYVYNHGAIFAIESQICHKNECHVVENLSNEIFFLLQLLN